jgi:PAS domain S-box-containing protein
MNKRFKILVVDDDPANIQIMTSALMDEYDILTALGGHDAIRLLKEHIPDLILLDVMMPDLSGFEVCSIIKSLEAYADIPVIFLTALDTLDGELQGLELGAIDYLTKPINFNLLKLRVRNHLELKERNALLKEQRDLLAQQKEELELINEQMRVTKASLREANEFSEQIIKSAHEGIVVYDLNLHYRVWNPFMEKITGKTEPEVLGRHPSELFSFVESSGLTEHLEKVLAGDIPITIDFPYSIPETDKSGWASDLSVPLRNTDGEIIGVIATIRDTTWRKQILEELQQALEETKSANDTMTRLLRTVAHEFRTPLGLLTGSTDIMDRYWDQLTTEKRSEQNEHIRNAARQLSNLLNSVMLFTQMGTNIPMKPQMLDIGKFCRTAAAEVETVWGAGHKFNITIEDCGTSLLDEILFRRVLENLLTNAFRFTPSDGSLSLHVRSEENRLCLEIIDTGIGIPEEEQPLIFDAFYRTRNVGDRRGMGLGLSIVHEALTQMRGTISVSSRTGAGTTMKVEIPLCTQS